MPTLPTMPVNRVCRPVPRCDAVLRRGADMMSPGKGEMRAAEGGRIIPRRSGRDVHGVRPAA